MKQAPFTMARLLFGVIAALIASHDDDARAAQNSQSLFAALVDPATSPQERDRVETEIKQTGDVSLIPVIFRTFDDPIDGKPSRYWMNDPFMPQSTSVGLASYGDFSVESLILCARVRTFDHLVRHSGTIAEREGVLIPLFDEADSGVDWLRLKKGIDPILHESPALQDRLLRAVEEWAGDEEANRVAASAAYLAAESLCGFAQGNADVHDRLMASLWRLRHAWRAARFFAGQLDRVRLDPGPDYAMEPSRDPRFVLFAVEAFEAVQRGERAVTLTDAPERSCVSMVGFLGKRAPDGTPAPALPVQGEEPEENTACAELTRWLAANRGVLEQRADELQRDVHPVP